MQATACAKFIDGKLSFVGIVTMAEQSSNSGRMRPVLSVPNKIAVLVSGRGSNLQALLDACASGRLAAEVCLVVSNKAGILALERAERASVPHVVLEAKKGQKRVDYDRELLALLAPYAPDVLALAGFMRILSSEFCREW